MVNTAQNVYVNPNVEKHLMIHQQNLQLFGVAIPGMIPFEGVNGEICFREMRLHFRYRNFCREGVSLKLPVVDSRDTLYVFDKDTLHYRDDILEFDTADCVRIPIPEEENEWHYKGYTFPYRGTCNPFEELRLNFRITGHCPGRCQFCHRWHSYRMSVKRRVYEPEELITEIVRCVGSEIFSLINRVLIITELLGSEKPFLSLVEKTRDVISRYGFGTDKHFGCCAQDVRTYDGLKRLNELVYPSRYSFSLEIFKNRSRIMGKYKGLDMGTVMKILTDARKAGFEEIQINYIAGLDSVQHFKDGFRQLRENGLIDSVGLSTFTAFTQTQRELRHKEAWEWTYYEELAAFLNDLGIKAYNTDGYDMRTPFLYKLQSV